MGRCSNCGQKVTFSYCGCSDCNLSHSTAECGCTIIYLNEPTPLCWIQTNNNDTEVSEAKALRTPPTSEEVGIRARGVL